MKNNFYIYIHVKPHNGEIFYVGKGKGNRAYSKRGRNTFWKNNDRKRQRHLRNTGQTEKQKVCN